MIEAFRKKEIAICNFEELTEFEFAQSCLNKVFATYIPAS